MTTPRPARKTVACLGGGVIGAGWAARFIQAGNNATVYDPDPEAPEKIRAALENARRARRNLTPEAPEDFGELRFAGSVAEACRGADFAQESAPEREEVKIPLLCEADSALPAGAVIASSTSGLLPSRLQAKMKNPERLCVGHPFNPVYLLPLVEICGGEKTAPATIAAAESFYRQCGMRPLIVRKEIDGFIADRLMEALWREALWLARDDIATVEEIDDAVRFGCGLRWAFMGTFLTFRLAGGKGGMRHFLHQFGPALQLPWTKLTDVPELTDDFIEKLARQSDAQAEGKSVAELEHMRDECLTAVMKSLQIPNASVGRFLNEREGERREQTPPPEEWGAPLRLHRTRVPPEWIDYNGHMNESRYLQAASDASDALLAMLGADAQYAAAGKSFYTAETHLRHLSEAFAGDEIQVETRAVDGDEKRLHLFHTLHRRADGGEWAVAATAEHMLLHVDMKSGKAAAADGRLAENMRKLLAAQSALPAPEGVGAKVGRR